MGKLSKLMMFVAGAAIASAALFLTAGVLGADEDVYMLIRFQEHQFPQDVVKGEWGRLKIKRSNIVEMFPTLEHCLAHAEGVRGQSQCVKIGTWKPFPDMEVLR